MKNGMNGLGLAVAVAMTVTSWAPSALADGDNTPDIQTTTLTQCYVAVPPQRQTSVTGAAGDTNDSNNACNTGYYANQTLVYTYRLREEDLLIVSPKHGPVVTQKITKELPQSETFTQTVACEDRDSFTSDAITYFANFYQNLQSSICH